MPLQNAGLAQPLRSAGGLLGGLEEEEDVPGQLRKMGGGVLRQGKGQGGVAVVPAGVHLPREAGGVGQSRGLCYRQGVHIRPKRRGFRLSRVEKGAEAAWNGSGDFTA